MDTGRRRVTAFLSDLHSEKLVRAQIVVRRFAGIVRMPTITETLEFLLDNLPIEELERATNTRQQPETTEPQVREEKPTKVKARARRQM